MESFAVYIGPFSTQYDCEVATEDYRKNNPDAYGLLVSKDKRRVEIYGIGSVNEIPNWRENEQSTSTDNQRSTPEKLTDIDGSVSQPVTKEDAFIGTWDYFDSSDKWGGSLIISRNLIEFSLFDSQQNQIGTANYNNGFLRTNKGEIINYELGRPFGRIGKELFYEQYIIYKGRKYKKRHDGRIYNSTNL
jgi:hypothetical protein